jgi:hypothetical protein
MGGMCSTEEGEEKCVYVIVSVVYWSSCWGAFCVVACCVASFLVTLHMKEPSLQLTLSAIGRHLACAELTFTYI